MKPFQYQILRFMRSIVNGEFINVGIILYDPKTCKILTKTIIDTERIENFFAGIDIKQFNEVLDGICRALKECIVDSNELAEITKEIHGMGMSSFIFSQVRRGISDNFVHTLDMLFSELVIKYNKK